MRLKFTLISLILLLVFILNNANVKAQGAVYPLTKDICETTASFSLSWSGSGTVDHWERGNGGSWTNIGAAGQTSITQSTPTAGEYQYRTYVNLGGGSYAYSVASTVTVYAQSYAGSNVSISFDAADKCKSNNTGTVQIDLTNATGEVDNWVYSYTNDAPWYSLGETNSTFTYNNLGQTTYYKALVKNGACPAVLSSNTATITVLDEPNGGTASIDDAELCEGSTTTLRTTGYTGASIQWQEYTTSWSDKGSGAVYTINPNPAYASYKYRAKAVQTCKDNTNAVITQEGYSNEVSLTVYQTTAAVDPVGDKVVAYDDATVNNITVTPTNGSVKRWEYSPDNKQWTPLTDAGNTYSYHNLTATTYYRVVVQNGACSEATSNNSVKITVANGGSISSTGTDFCSSPSNSGTLTATGIEGTTWTWQSSVSPFTSWTNLASDVNTLAFNNLTETTKYRINVNSGLAYSDPITINVASPSVAGTLTPNFAGAPYVCYDDATSREIDLSGNTGDVVRWESSTTNGAPWTNIEETSTKLNFDHLKETTYYRAVVKNGACPETTTSSQVIEVATGGSVASDLDVCENDPVTRSVTLSNHNGVIDNWEKQEYSTNWGAWQTIGNAGNTSYAFNNLSVSTRYRAVIESACTDNVNSSYAQISVYPVSVGGTTSGDKTVRPGDNSGTITVSGITGNVVRWEYSHTAVEPWASISNTTTTLSYKNLDQTTYYRAVVQSGPCDETVSDIATITVAKAGYISKDVEVCAYDATNRTLYLKDYLGTISRWQYSLDQNTWYDISGTAGQDSYTFSNLSQTRSYRAVITEDGGDIYSDYATVSVNPLPAPDFSATTECLNDQTTFTDKSTIASGSIKVYEWDFNDGNSSATQSPVHTYAKDGDYSVKLTLTSDKLCTNSITKTVSVEPLPGVNFAFTEECDQTAIPFVNQSSLSGYTLTYSWDFGDGNTDNTPNPSHTYSTYGKYSVTLQAVANGKCSNSLTKVVEVHENPVADFSFTNVCDGNAMEFINKSSLSDGNMSYSWDFSDNSNTSTEENPKYTFTQAGTYNVSLQATSPWGCKNIKTQSVQIYYMPVADFSVSNNCFGTETQFTDASTIGGSGTLSWNWDFKDGNTATTQSPTHTYSASGSYVVKLAVTSDNNCKDEVEKEVRVYPMPIPNFSTQDVCASDSANFSNLTTISGGSITYQWDFGDNSGSSINENPKYLFSAAGKYSVKLKAISDNNCIDSVSKEIEVYSVPAADFSATEVCANNTTNFTDKSTITNDTIVKYLWDFGNGMTSSLQNPSYTYVSEGNYNVTLSVESSHNCSNSTNKTIKVNVNPEPAFTQENVCAQTAMQFTENSTNISGTPIYEWDFGDGTGVSTSQNPAYSYTNDGYYTVKLTVTNGNGCKKSVSKEVEVYPLPVPDFNFEAPCENQNVQFNNASTLKSGSMSFNWDFGNGKTSNNTDPSTSYTQWGNYTVKLDVNTNRGCSVSLSKTLSVHQNPVVNFTVNDVCYGFATPFTNLSAINDGNLSYKWSFGDKNTSNEASPNYLYGSPGVYEVILTATSQYGCSNSASNITEVYPKPYASFNVAPICVGSEIKFDNVSNIEAGTMTYSWDLGNGSSSSDENPVVTYEQAGNYNVSLTATSDKSCTNQVVKNLNVYYSPEPDFVNDTVCDGSPTSFTNLSKINNGQIVYYQWDFGDLSNSLQESPVHQYYDAGDYDVTLLVESDKGCKKSLTKTVRVNYVPIANFSTEPVCLHKAMQFTDKTYFPENVPGVLNYEWNMGDGNTYKVAEPLHIYSQSGIYLVKLTVASSEGQCANTISRQVIVYDLPYVYAGKDTIVPKGYPLVLQAQADNGNYIWTPGNEMDNQYALQPLLKPSTTSDYVLEVTDFNGCVNSDTLTVEVDENYNLYGIDYSASNIITPDENGQNDVWVVPNIDYYEGNHVHIYDRWGVEVFSATNYQNDWNGTNKQGDLLPDGTYYYVIYFDNTDKVLRGAITLLRNIND